MPKIHSRRQFNYFGLLAGRGVGWARRALRGKKKGSYGGGGRRKSGGRKRR